MDRIKTSIKSNLKTSSSIACSIAKHTIDTFYKEQIALLTKTFLTKTKDNLSKNFCITINYVLHDELEKKLISVLLRISDKTKKYIIGEEHFKGNKTFFISVPNHKTVIKVITPEINPSKVSVISFTFIGLDALQVTRKFLNTYKAINKQDCNTRVNTLYRSNTGNGKEKWTISYKNIVSKNINEIFTNIDTHALISYIKQWEHSKNFYTKLNLLHKKGILLYGVPGTGKTTLAKAIAKDIESEIYIVNMLLFDELQIEAIKNDIEKYGHKNKTNILIFEDIDCVFSTRDKLQTEQQKKAAQLLLQFLDGVHSLPNILFIATTNHIENLDEALIREGRFDIKIEMKNISHDIADNMCKHFELSPEESHSLLSEESFPINPAYLENKIVKHIIEKTEDSFDVLA